MSLLRSSALLERAIALLPSSSHPLSIVIISFLLRRHLRVALVDSTWPTRLTSTPPPVEVSSAEAGTQANARGSSSARDGRVYAISPASRQLLQAVGAWQLLPANCTHTYDSMQV